MRRCRVGGVGFLAALVALAGVAACDLRLTGQGDYTCTPDNPASCPPGWYCQMRAAYPGDYRCYAAPGPYCGDGTRDQGEVCDAKEAFAADSCVGAGFQRGQLRCKDDCSEILKDACGGGCGDGALDPGEECDGTNLGGLTCLDLGFHEEPGLACDSKCHFDTSTCGGGTCGDGVVNGLEDCDANDLGVASCQSLGYYEGPLACNAVCRFDASGCSGRCGDGFINGLEDCDGNELAGATCESLAFHPGTLRCGAGCRYDASGCAGYCGDGVINGGEQCDGDGNLDGTTCDVLAAPGGGTYHPGTLRCLPDCTFNAAGCGGYCGDGVRNGGETCDATDFAGTTCRDFPSPGGGPYYAGTLGCSADCATVVTTGCSGYCGDLARNGAELCDGDPPAGDHGDFACATYGYYAGELACRADCTGFDRAACTGFCGDGRVNGDETCDGRDQAGAACTSYSRYLAGWLGCDARCRPTFEGCAEEWGTMTSGTTDPLFSVWGSGPTDVFAVGSSPSWGVILHHDGNSWLPMFSGTVAELDGVWGSSPTDVFAVGWSGTIIHYDGISWSPMTSGTSAWLWGVWGSSATDVFAVGNSGRIRHYDGTSWSAMTSGTAVALYGVWGSSATDVFAVGAGGTIRHYDGTSWSAMTSGTSFDLQSVWGSSATDVFAVGEDATILHYDGVSWTPMSTGTDAWLFGVWGSSATDVFAVGYISILHYNGVSWAPVAVPGSLWLHGVWGNSLTEVFAVSDEGTILRVPGNLPPPYGGQCTSPHPLYCAATLDPYDGSNGLGHTAAFDSYGCAGGRPTTGNEAFFRLDCPVTGMVTVRLTPAAADLDLIILGADTSDPQRGCDPTRCIAASQTNGLGVEEATFNSTKGDRYYAVVDGYDGAVSGYTLEIVCAKE